MTIKYYPELIQSTDEWFQARCGLLTASEMENIITPKTLQPVKKKNPDEEIEHLWELLAQRITKHVEPAFKGSAMLRGEIEESYARNTYADEYGEVEVMGFVTNDKWGFTLGYSPDWLVGSEGQGECKSRCQKYQIEAIVCGEMPDEFRIQIQTGLLVTERPWCDFVSYCGGMYMFTKRIYPDLEVQKSIIEAATIFEARLAKRLEQYHAKISDKSNRLIPTKRIPLEGIAACL